MLIITVFIIVKMFPMTLEIEINEIRMFLALSRIHTVY